jgi:hypothetical protein
MASAPVMLKLRSTESFSIKEKCCHLEFRSLILDALLSILLIISSLQSCIFFL